MPQRRLPLLRWPFRRCSIARSGSAAVAGYGWLKPLPGPARMELVSEAAARTARVREALFAGEARKVEGPMTDNKGPMTRAEGAEGVPAARPSVQAGGGSSTLTSALSLWFEIIDLGAAIELNRRWHSRLPHLDHRVAAWLCYSGRHDGELCAVAVWSLPVARSLPQDGSCLELRRLALASSCPRNAASRMLGWMARDVPRRRPGVHRLVSYQDCEVHSGAIYRAAGWVPRPAASGGEWNHAGRHRVAKRVRTKVRWERLL